MSVRCVRLCLLVVFVCVYLCSCASVGCVRLCLFVVSVCHTDTNEHNKHTQTNTTNRQTNTTNRHKRTQQTYKQRQTNITNRRKQTQQTEAKEHSKHTQTSTTNRRKRTQRTDANKHNKQTQTNTTNIHKLFVVFVCVCLLRSFVSVRCVVPCSGPRARHAHQDVLRQQRQPSPRAKLAREDAQALSFL